MKRYYVFFYSHSSKYNVGYHYRILDTDKNLDCAEGIQDLIKHLDKELGCPVSIVNWQELKGEPTLESKEKVDTAVRDALENLVDYVERNTCRHENTHRGGVLWTICDDCGMKWADDRGGFPGYAAPRRKHELHC